MPQVTTHWWGTEITFTEPEKRALQAAIISGIDAATDEGLIADALEAALGTELAAALIVALGLFAIEIAACNLVGRGGFRVCISWISPIPPTPGVLVLPNF
jgi:hypothetical protein